MAVLAWMHRFINFLLLMSYQVLARKWRPQKFSDVVGQEHVLMTLAQGFSLERIHHAYLFSGTRGVGKTTIARLLAKGLNCTMGITATPCGQCENCLAIEQGSFMDLIEIDAASRAKVEDTRDLLDNVQYAPASGRFKVYLIDEIHMLSRHSFNALLKTLEEPPAHVKFLLATTDPHKLPVTILSRCLQLHLKALDFDQILGQLKKVLKAEQITSDSNALHLLARAADGSIRDALSLTDQAIAMGQGQVTTDSVRQMLGTFDDEQALAILEALINADGEAVMAQIARYTEKNIDLENLLVETQTMLHNIAMIQLIPKMFNKQYTVLEQRMRKIASTLPAADLQLYYQILLVGRKEIAYAPSRRMGIEMTLLRALAFHPKALISQPEVVYTQTIQQTQTMPSQDLLPTLRHTYAPQNTQRPTFPDSSSKLLESRNQVVLRQRTLKIKKNEPAVISDTVRKKKLEQTPAASLTEHRKQLQTKKLVTEKTTKLQNYRSKISNTAEPTSMLMAMPNTLPILIENKKKLELLHNIKIESLQPDVWAGEISKLNLPKLVQVLALNSFVQQQENGNIYLHLRSAQYALNSPEAQKILTAALSKLYDRQIALTVVIDDNPTKRTPVEWKQDIYKKKLARARQSMLMDINVQTMHRLFDAELDEESIQPI